MVNSQCPRVVKGLAKMQIIIPDAARQIIEQLNQAGYEAYVVGGCVRDSLLGKKPEDWDITTSAKPEVVKKLFKRTIDTGLLHGTVTVMKNYEAYEVTTYRVDGEYEDFRRPKEVSFTSNLTEDLKRRDFTINAMAYNDKDGIIDIFGGIEDLKSKIIRSVGNAKDRFNEDALRMLRAIRFAAQLDFCIDEATKIAIKENAGLLNNISAERIQVELTKTIMSNNSDKIIDAYELGITAEILPEFDEMMETPQNNPHHKYSVGIHSVEVMKNVPSDIVLRYSALLHDVGKPATRTTDKQGIDHFYKHHLVGEEIAAVILKRLKLDNNTIKSVKKLVRWHDYGIEGESNIKNFRKSLSNMGIEFFSEYVILKKADILAQSDYHREDKFEILNTMKEMYKLIIRDNHCLRVVDLAINGNDLIDLGMSPGKDVGDVLNMLLKKVLSEPTHNNRETLLEYARKMNK